MSRFYRLQIGSVHLTDNGLVGGIPCKMKISPVESLRVNYAGQTAPSANGTPHTVVFPVGTKSRPLSVEVESLPEAVFELIVPLINNALANNTTITLIGTGDYGDFNIAAVPTMPFPITGSSEFINGRLKRVTFHFTTAS